MQHAARLRNGIRLQADMRPARERKRIASYAMTINGEAGNSGDMSPASVTVSACKRILLKARQSDGKRRNLYPIKLAGWSTSAGTAVPMLVREAHPTYVDC